MTSKLVPPGGYLMRIDAAARDLGLEVAELLEYAEELDGLGPPLRVCVMVPDDLFIHPAALPEPEGLLSAERRFAYIEAPNTPGFFYELGDTGEATLQLGDSFTMVDGSGIAILHDDRKVRLVGLRVPREDIEALKVAELDEASTATAWPTSGVTMAVPPTVGDTTGPTEARNRRWIDKAKKMLADAPEKFQHAGGKPAWLTLARALQAEGLGADLKCGTLRDLLRDHWHAPNEPWAG